ncbi:MAG: ATP-binding protein, partial [Candidatus Omnitrophota bacterium]|nr:ATP-binding protein [Candidatus Omnitrophota bacterium]
MVLTGEIHKSIEIPSDIKYIKKVSFEILEHLKRLKIDKSIRFDVRLAVEEAVRNAIEHGHKRDKNLRVIITYTVNKDRAEIEVEDQGKGFDVVNVPDPRTGDNIMKGSG